MIKIFPIERRRRTTTTRTRTTRTRRKRTRTRRFHVLFSRSHPFKVPTPPLPKTTHSIVLDGDLNVLEFILFSPHNPRMSLCLFPVYRVDAVPGGDVPKLEVAVEGPTHDARGVKL
jgi:hypothetical protein